MTPLPFDSPASDPEGMGLIPCDGQAVTFEVSATETGLDAELVRHAAAAVLHYFRHDLKRVSVTVAEFSEALERVLRRMGLAQWSAVTAPATDKSPEASIDLRVLVGDGFELAFFQRLRAEIRGRLHPETHAPRLLRCHGLRSCVLRLAGVRRWSRRCQQLRDSIVDHARQAAQAEGLAAPIGLVIHSGIIQTP